MDIIVNICFFLGSVNSTSLLNINIYIERTLLRAWLNGNTMFYETFVCFYVSEAKPLCFSLCSQMFDGVERCLILQHSKCLSRK